MPNIKSAMERVRRSEKARQRHQAIKARVTSTRRKTFATLAGTDGAQAQALYRQYCSVLDKAAKHGTIKRNTAIRRKRRAAARLALLQQRPA